jgi:uncharacterized membrane protein YphA (DoxX/SURF4 family)
MTTPTLTASRGKTIGLWVLRLLLAALFLFAGLMKLSGQDMMVQEFDVIGWGQWLRYFTGILELMGAIALLVPSVSAFGALILLAIDVGAFFAQLLILHQDVIHTLVIGLLLGGLVYLQRQQILARLKR